MASEWFNVEKAAPVGVQSEVVGSVSISQSATVLSRRRVLERVLFQIRVS